MKGASANTINGYAEGKLEVLSKERELLRYLQTLINDNLAAVENEIKLTLSLKEDACDRLLNFEASKAILSAVKQLQEKNKKD